MHSRSLSLGFAAAALSACLPSNDLSSYADGEGRSAPGRELAESAPDTSEVVDGSAAPVDPPSEPAPEADCGRECVTPPLELPEGDAGSGEVVTQRLDAGGAISPEASAPDAAGGGPSCGGAAVLGPGDRCFSLVAGSWDAARAACQDRGAGWGLVIIRDAQQNAWLAERMGPITEAWVGATDSASEGEWRWLGDVGPFWSGTGSAGSSVGGAYENWNDGETPEPNGGDASDCLRLVSGGAWADIQCETELLAICEGPPL